VGATFGFVGFFVTDHLGLVESREACKGLVQDLVVCFIPQVAYEDAEVIFGPFQQVRINPAALPCCGPFEGTESSASTPPERLFLQATALHSIILTSEGTARALACD
jgi:hypothetical protein